MRALPVRKILLRSVKPLCRVHHRMDSPFCVALAVRWHARCFLTHVCTFCDVDCNRDNRSLATFGTAILINMGCMFLIPGVVGVAEGHAAEPVEPFSYAHVVSLNPYSATRPVLLATGSNRYKDGRLREYEAWSCDDVDSVHNDYQRHLLCPRPPYTCTRMRRHAPPCRCRPAPITAVRRCASRLCRLVGVPRV